MQQLGTQPLETKRLILRRFCRNDAQAMFTNWASNPEVTRFLVWPPHADVSVTQSVLNDWTARYDEPDFYQWAIVPKDSFDAPIGSISVVGQDARVASAHIGYCIGRAWWHKGLTSEALAAVMRFLFEQAGFNRVESRHDPDNPHSGMVMQACGMRREGVMRKADLSNRGVTDYVLYALLRDEYLQARAASGADDDFTPGYYRHFKGRAYELLYMATHSETREPLVVYRALYGEYGVWVRPASMWNERVTRDGKTVKRFTYIGPPSADEARP